MTTTPNSFVAVSASLSPMPGIINQQIPINAITNSPGVGVSGQIGSLSQTSLGLRQNVSQTQLAGSATAGGLPTTISMESKVLDKRRLHELVKEVDPLEQLDEEVEEFVTDVQGHKSLYLWDGLGSPNNMLMAKSILDPTDSVLMQIADDFIETVVTTSCNIAKHRKSNILEVKDVQLHLERSWGMWIPGFGTDDLRPYKKACTSEAHKQRLALIRKTLKKT